MYDGAFCLSCVLFGCETEHNGSKLNKLFKEPLKNWQTAAGKLEKHQKQSLIHRDSMLQLLNFKSVMMGETKGIDEQADTLRSARIKDNSRFYNENGNPNRQTEYGFTRASR